MNRSLPSEPDSRKPTPAGVGLPSSPPTSQVVSVTGLPDRPGGGGGSTARPGWAGIRLGWSGYSCHRVASRGVPASRSFQGGSIQVVGEPGASATLPYGSRIIHSHGYRL